MSPRNNNAKTKIKVTEKTTLQITQEETFEISDGTSSQLPPARQRHQESGGNPCRRGLPKGNPNQRALSKGKPPQKRQQRPQHKKLPPPKKEPVRKLVGSISGETLKALTAQHAKPQSKVVPDLYFSLLRKKQKHHENAKRKALTGSKVKALPAPKKRSK